MTHLNRSEMLLYQMKRGLSVEQRQVFTDHLQSCGACTHELEQLQQKSAEMSWNELQTCEKFRQEFLAPIHEEMNLDRVPGIKEHLDDCELCRTLFHTATDLPDWQTIAATHIEIPTKAQTKIEALVLKALKKSLVQKKIKGLPEKIRSEADELISRFTLTFRPIIPELVFRGEELDEFNVIEHRGGDLWLETGLKNALLELTSIFEGFTLTGKTDENGELMFKNLANGDYIVYTEGHRLIKVNVKSK